MLNKFKYVSFAVIGKFKDRRELSYLRRRRHLFTARRP